MLKITEDVSQWKTIPSLISYINSNNIELVPLIIEIGASDGKLNSNSYTLIKENGWYGILVEPIIEDVLNISKIYTPEEMQRIHVECSCMSDKPGIVKLNVCNNSGLNQLSSLLKVNSDTHEVLVPAYTFLQLQKKYEIKYVGILSIDTEGLDYIILKSMFETTDIKPQIIITESWHNNQNNLTNKEKTKLIISNDYTKIMQIEENDIFLRN